MNQGFGAEGGNRELPAITTCASHSLERLVVITGMMSWLQLEAYLGILASCLPTIRFLFEGLSPDSVISSIRSDLSLHSLRTTHSHIVDDGVGSHRGLSNNFEGSNMNELTADGK